MSSVSSVQRGNAIKRSEVVSDEGSHLLAYNTSRRLVRIQFKLARTQHVPVRVLLDELIGWWKVQAPHTQLSLKGLLRDGFIVEVVHMRGVVFY